VPSKKKSKSKFSEFEGLKFTEVLVTLEESVKLNEGFLGICISSLPQYLIKAILLGASHDVMKLTGAAALEINTFKFIRSIKIQLQL
jgi:hypothetical protein